ncbi:hypothetical protein NMY22_g11140 [Coprinellus aureogranulatus]|nr:hypothetical protein NMY22_g11140 [Coprinellus aureogranulatus]
MAPYNPPPTSPRHPPKDGIVLPVDILALIFCSLITSEVGEFESRLHQAISCIKQLVALGTVNKLWRDATLTATLWAPLLNLDLPNVVFNNVFQRTALALLDIEYNARDQPNGPNIRTHDPNWVLVLSDMTRIRSLRLDFVTPNRGTPDPGYLQSRLHQLPSMISDIKLRMPIEQDHRILCFPFLQALLGGSPKTRRLELIDCHVPPSSFSQSLTHLDIRYTDATRNATPSIFPWLLFLLNAGMPRLEVLSLHCNYHIPEVYHQPIPLPPTLKTLSVSSSTFAIQHLLSQAKIPPQCNISLSVIGRQSGQTLSTLFPMVAALWGSLPSREAKFKFFCAGGSAGFELSQWTDLRFVKFFSGIVSKADFEVLILANDGSGFYPVLNQSTCLQLDIGQLQDEDAATRMANAEPFFPALRKYISVFRGAHNVHIMNPEIVTWGLCLEIIQPNEFDAEIHQNEFLALRKLGFSSRAIMKPKDDIHKWIKDLVWNRYKLESSGFPVSRIEVIRVHGMFPTPEIRHVDVGSSFGRYPRRSAWETYYNSVMALRVVLA